MRKKGLLAPSLRNINIMNGDFVRFKYSDLVHKIKCIAGNSVKVDKGNWFSINTISPIPLSSEILENNGFVYKDDFWFLYERNEDRSQYVPVVCIRFNQNGGVIDVALAYEGKCSCVYYNISYVHQLQDALRICGIEKEITL